MERNGMILTTLLFFGFSAGAQELAQKYQIQPQFGVKAACEVNNEKEISQIKLYVDVKDLKTAKSTVETEIKVAACTIAGFKKSSEIVPMPVELFRGDGEVQLGRRKLQDDKFAALDVRASESSSAQAEAYELRLFTTKGEWDKINPIKLEFQKRGGQRILTTIQLYVVNKRTWITAHLRKKEINPN